jgi:hypothetical protein
MPFARANCGSDGEARSGAGSRRPPRGDLAAYLRRRLPVYVAELERALADAEPNTAHSIARLLLHFEARIRRHRDRHKVKIICKLCRRHAYIAARHTDATNEGS